MVTTASTSTSLKEYLKKYENNDNDDKKKKKKKTKTKTKTKTVPTGVLVVDEDPVWQKPVNIEEEEDEPDNEPQVDEDINYKFTRRLEILRAKGSYNQISEDGSGWVSLSDAPNRSTSVDVRSDISPPRKRKARYDTPSPEAGKNPSDFCKGASDLSPPRQHRRRNDSPSPSPRGRDGDESDLSPPRQHRRRNDSPSPGPRGRDGDESDLSPPRQHRRRADTHSPAPRSERAASDLSPPRQRRKVNDSLSPEPDSSLKTNMLDLSPPRRGRRYDSVSPDAGYSRDLSPPRRQGRSRSSPSPVTERKSLVSGARDTDMRDLYPPRRERPSKSIDAWGSEDLSPPRKSRRGSDKLSTRDSTSRQMSTEADLSPLRKSNVEKKTGLITGKDVSEEIAKIKKDEWSRFNEMDPSTSGRGAEPVYRVKGKRVSKDEYLKSTKKEKKPKKEEKKLEWGKGLAQKREAEAKLQELELEKDKPFARSRDDPELDRMMKDRVRWGDPMAHLVKRKQSDLILPDFGDSEKMKDSGFIVPQGVPSHSWLKRGLDYEPNRYGIKPGRHWDGVNRSNGYEKQLFKRTNEKKATEQEAYLWSVSDM